MRKGERNREEEKEREEKRKGERDEIGVLTSAASTTSSPTSTCVDRPLDSLLFLDFQGRRRLFNECRLGIFRALVWSTRSAADIVSTSPTNRITVLKH